MAVGIAPARADYGHARLHLLDKPVGGRRAAAVVRNLEHVERTLVARDALGKQLRVDLLLNVSGKDDTPGSEVEVQHDRHVVDPSARVGRVERDSAGQRPVDVHADSVEPHRVPSGEGPTLPPQLGEPATVRSIAWAGPDHSRLCDLLDRVAIHYRGQTGHVILVRMGQDDQVQAPVPRGYPLIE
jgi:hypothetical protein